MARKMNTAQKEKPLVKKTNSKKRNSKTASLSSPVSIVNDMRKKETLECLEAIENLIKHNKMLTVYSYACPHFTTFYYVIAKLTNLEVCISNNNNVFMPYEKKEKKDFCALYILQLGKDLLEDERFIKELKQVGCPIKKVQTKHGVYDFFVALD